MLGPGMEGQGTIPDFDIIGEFLISFDHLLFLGVFMTAALVEGHYVK